MDGDLPRTKSLTLAQDIKRMCAAGACGGGDGPDADASAADPHALISGAVDEKKKALMYQSSLRR